MPTRLNEKGYKMKKYLSLLICSFALTACQHGMEHTCDYYRSNLETPVYFKFGTNEITDESKQKIKEGVVFLQKHRFRRVQLDGYTDEIGGQSDANMNLSRERVETVRDFLVENGIAKKRISMFWHGAIQGKPYDRHRRVELTVK